MNRLAYLLKRILLSIPVVIFGTSLTFIILYAGPIDPVSAILGRGNANGPAAAEIRRKLNLNEPLWSRYFDFMADLLTFNLGQSYVFSPSTPAFEIVLQFLPRTMWMGAWAVLIPLFIGIPLGFYAGLNPNTLGDYTASFSGIVWRAMPNFWLAVIFMSVLSSSENATIGIVNFLNSLPAVSGVQPFNWEAWIVQTKVIGPPELSQLLGPNTTLGLPMPNWENLLAATKKILPASIVLGSASMGNEMRIGRTAMLESKNSNYVEMAKAKGLPPRTIVWKHIFRNALIPLVPVITAEAFVLVGGSVLIEYVFAINGIGYVFLQAMMNGDIPLAGALMYVFILLLVIMNIVQDILYTVIDPRVGFEGQ
ncbi:ABC transporter permease [Salarchaeum sp. JOR-1]|uniref:ABC transporter permease n=1 Tax=Salarchaeum sp. JOR-1 TaxID=2599399 RepID=UPI0011984FF9|nr:ABC transporter permease [Salarchaeum sp. JOR-1]QDX40224.1 ABC transporter permease [Salarchaeum sp. JOR-1]